MKSSILHFLNTILQNGWENENDIDLQKNIYFANGTLLLSFLTDLILSFSSLIIFQDIKITIACLCHLIFQISIFILIKEGNHLIARVIKIIGEVIIIEIICIFYSHESYLDPYFIIIGIISIFIFNIKELKWLVICLSISLIFFIVEVTPFQNYLPDYRIISESELKIMNIIGALSLVFCAIYIAILFSYITLLKQKELLDIQKELIKSQEKLEFENKNLEIFNLTVAHDVRTPISTAKILNKMNKDLVLKTSINNLEIETTFDNIDYLLNKIDDLVVSYLSYYKISLLPKTNENFSILESVKTIANELKIKYTNCNITINLEDIYIYSNKLLFETVIKNLIENGIKHNLNNPQNIIIDQISETNYFNILIKDNGIGIDKENYENIFTPFKKINTKVEGSGLGLSIALKAAFGLNGNLQISQSNKSGTIFNLQLPYF